MEGLIGKIEIFENEFDHYSRIAKELEDYKEDLAHLWSDNASREINSKFLNLFSDNCESISKYYVNQVQKLKSLNDTNINIENKCEEIKNLSMDINLDLSQCFKLRESSDSLLQDAYLKESETNALLKKTGELFKEIEILKNKHLQILKSI